MYIKEGVSPALEGLAELDKKLSQERLAALDASSWVNQYLQEENWDDETTVKIVKNPPFTWKNYPGTYTYFIAMAIYMFCMLLWALKVF